MLLIDNYDSVTFNLAQCLGEPGQDVRVLRNDAVDVAGIRALAPEHIASSPGPGRPEQVWITLVLVRELAGKIPIFGMCLGYEAIGWAFGGKVTPEGEIMHGKTSPIRHENIGMLASVSDPFEATRCRSLVVGRASLPGCPEVTAWTEHADGSFDEIMGLRHKAFAVEGVQFHPESILTRGGHDPLRNFLDQDLPKAA